MQKLHFSLSCIISNISLIISCALGPYKGEHDCLTEFVTIEWSAGTSVRVQCARMINAELENDQKSLEAIICFQ